MKKILSLLLAGTMAFSITACGNTANKSSNRSTKQSSTVKTSTKSNVNSASNVTESVVTQQSSKSSSVESSETKPKVEPASIAIGEKISLDFVEIAFEESGVEKNIQQSIKKGVVTRTTGPEPKDGKHFLYLRGTIKNLAKQELPVYDFFVGNFKVDDYDFKVDTNQCSIIEDDGNTMETISPLSSGKFTIYAEIPDELAKSYNEANFIFGFYDLFDNNELSKNKAFSDNPIAECPYQYLVNIGKAEKKEKKKEKKKIKVGKTIKTSFAEIKIKKIEFSYDILPDNTSGYYTHYPAEKGKVYIHIDTDVKNIQKQPLEVDNILKVEADYNGGFTYTGGAVAEDSSLGFRYANITSIDPLSKLGVRYMIDCPQEVEESKDSLILTFTIDNEEYEYKMR